jgi:hypothetical protein
MGSIGLGPKVDKSVLQQMGNPNFYQNGNTNFPNAAYDQRKTPRAMAGWRYRW